MRPDGRLHIGHYHGVLKNWVRLQHEYDCYFVIADWHSVANHRQDPANLAAHTRELLTDWLAVGVNPSAATVLVQSRVPEQAELHLLLSMLTPLDWLERLPVFRELQKRHQQDSLALSYGMLGYPLLQAADILTYRAGLVPVGADQVDHIKLTADIAHRFNQLHSCEPGFVALAEAAIRKLPRKVIPLYQQLREQYQQRGDREAMETARALVLEQTNLTLADQNRLLGYLEGVARQILPEPQVLLTDEPRLPGIDGDVMSRSVGNHIPLRSSNDDISHKIRNMRTDPQRIRLTDAGDPHRCPVRALHRVYSSADELAAVDNHCQNAARGCLDCKQPLIDAIIAEQEPIRERAETFERSPDMLDTLLAEGSERARDAARATLEDVRKAMGLLR